MKSVTVPELSGIDMGIDSDAAGGIDICPDTNQYIDFTKKKLYICKRIVLYSATNSDFKMQVNGNASASPTLNNSTVTTNRITCGPISRTG